MSRFRSEDARRERGVILTRLQADQIIRLLGLLDIHIQEAMQSTLAPGETTPRDEVYKDDFEADRRTRLSIGAFIRLLGGGK